ncbi:hypothetical protein BIFADO_00480 [Bifidobacterium adolescentis L2-32]|uniref:Uncharacterized protein n=1 Tax=Bifidobacterium adolescentis L2-32 TaxID=411481 RepID=A7A3T5_BIFAD|nr:hypothetical protein BIFADO_00480 [Bifidobacterium adolescentis L2-32]
MILLNPASAGFLCMYCHTRNVVAESHNRKVVSGGSRVPEQGGGTC